MPATDRPQNDKPFAAPNADIHIVGFNAGDSGPDRKLALQILKGPGAITQKGGDLLMQSADGKQLLMLMPDGHEHLEIDHELKLASQQSAVNAEHQKLSRWADQNLKGIDRQTFEQDMDAFERRAAHDGVSSDDVIKTYQHIERLVNAKGDKPSSAKLREHLAEEIMHQAADPTSIEQGFHNTCLPRAVERRTYECAPAEAARLVTDMALTGKYVATDGTIVYGSSEPHDESRLWPIQEGRRSHASEIFQVTAVRIRYAKFKAKTGRDARYIQTEPEKSNDTGERLFNYSKRPPREFQEAGQKTRDPDLSFSYEAEISNAISSRNEKGIGFQHNDVIVQSCNAYPETEQTKCLNEQSDNLTVIHNEAELAERLKYMKEHHQLPLTFAVNTLCEPFYTDAGFGVGLHAVTIVDFDEKTGNVYIDNDNKRADRHGSDKPLSLHDLYTAMETGPEAQKILAADVKWNRQNGKIDSVKEMELLRLEKANGELNDLQYAERLRSLMFRTSERWATGGVTDQEQNRERQEISNLIRVLPLEEQSPFWSVAYNDQLISADNYWDMELDLDQRIARRKKHAQST